jgi:hypothetical protein
MGVLSVFFVFLWHLWSNFWWFLTSGPLVIEPMLEYLFPRYEDWVNQYVSRRKRRQIAYSLSLLGIVAASFFAFEDVYLKLEEKEQELARIYRISGMKGGEEATRAIEKLQVENKLLQADLSSTRDQLSGLQASLKPRRLTPEERDKFTAALASHDGQQFGVISVMAFPSCHECMTYRHFQYLSRSIVPRSVL